jgi:adenylyltransferase/sulfurtransferase
LQTIHDQRHLRQIILPEIGENGQSKLKNSRVLVLGTGGLGGPALFYLTAAGIGTLHLVDNDVVSLSNLNRQILFTEADIGKPKAAIACERLFAMDSTLCLVPHSVRLDEANVCALVENMDLVVDCVDNAVTREIVNKACVALNIPFVEAGIYGMDGYVFPVVPRQSACFACASQPRTSRSVQGPIPVLGAAAGMIGAIEAGIAVRMLLNLPVPTGIRHVYSLVDLSKTEIPIPRNPSCPVCGEQ